MRLPLVSDATSRAALAALAATTLLTVVFAAPARALTPDEVSSKIAEAQDALDTWQIERAAELAQELYDVLPDVPPVQAIVGQVKFHQGDYGGALKLLERSAEAGVDPVLLDLVRSTYEETKGSVTFTSKHFVLRTPKGKDELLAPIALDALEQAFDKVSRAFDYHPSHRIPVDILHDPRGLASVSTLTVAEIHASGTIALCKFNRLMITSPKALARGYSWLDTLAHEFIHLVISEKSKNTVPIWLHEGLAKYSETLWRGPPGLALAPASENLLADAVKKKKLITFEQMHPSMAKLPSQQDTALAFAEVFTVVEWMHQLRPETAHDPLAGYAITNKLLDELSSGRDMDAALAAAVGKNLSGVQRAWKRYLRKRKFTLVPGAEPRELNFVRNPRSRSRTVDEEESEGALEEAESREGRRFVRLGTLLMRRGRARAATVEYEKAKHHVGQRSPILSNRLAGLYLQLGDIDKARVLLDETLTAHPDDPQTHVLRGRLAVRQKRWSEARQSYERALWEHPFNPEIHAGLYLVGEETKDRELQSRAKNALQQLTGHAQQERDDLASPGDNEPFGTISVASQPWGELIIDGIPTGMTTPVADVRLAPGAHRVRVRDDVTGRQATTTVVLVEGAATRLSLTLADQTPETVEGWIAAEEALRRVDVEAPAVDAPEALEGAAADGGR